MKFNKEDFNVEYIVNYEEQLASRGKSLKSHYKVFNSLDECLVFINSMESYDRKIGEDYTKVYGGFEIVCDIKPSNYNFYSEQKQLRSK